MKVLEERKNMFQMSEEAEIYQNLIPNHVKIESYREYSSTLGQKEMTAESMAGNSHRLEICIMHQVSLM